ncbi:MAG TPA: hypothetical protein VNJ01_01120 [Bacteriovoracaceae bacterium]|nr:hypothetical protein [Bacteriovoracaceae bacterium]
MKLMSMMFLNLLLIANVSAGIMEAWGPLSDPNLMNPNFKKEFSRLPMSGRSANPRKFWSGDYWALNKGNINYRWNADDKKGFNLRSPSRSEVQRMSFNELSQLSPTEKYDIMVGRYDYPLVAEVAKIGDKKAEDWEGICHGWAPAAMNHIEPTPKTMSNPDGVQVPFGSSDIKALLSYYYANGYQVPDTHQMGRRCPEGNFVNRWFRGFGVSDKDCKADLNAGAFHIVLANRLGIEGIGFIADIDRYKQVWNHPISGFSSRIEEYKKPKRDSAPGTVRVVRVKTDITYTDESENEWNTVIGTSVQKVEDKDYEYDLDLDSQGNIIGGKWETKDRPDFLWDKERPSRFEGNLSQLGRLLND